MPFSAGAVLTAQQLNVLEAGIAEAGAFLNPAAGAIQRTVRAKLGDWLSVKDFGATGNSVADDAPGVRAAIAALDPELGGTVFLPPGRYRFGSTVVVNKPNVHIAGAGMFSSIVQATSHTFNLFQVTSVGQVEISDLWLQAFGNTTTQFWAVDGASAYRLTLRNIQATGLHSFCASSGAEFRAIDCRIYMIRPAAGIGFRFDGDVELREVTGCMFQNAPGADAAAGIVCVRGGGPAISLCQIMKMGVPVRISPLAGMNVFSTKLTGTWLDTSTGTGLFLDGSLGGIHRVAVSSGWFSSCQRGLFATGTVTGLAVTDTEIFDNVGAGVEIAANSNTPGLMLNGNRIAGNGGAGVSIGSNVSNFSLVGNAIGPVGDFGGNGSGIVVAGGNSDGYLIASNRLRANTGAALTDGGTGGSKVVSGNLV